MSVKSMDNVMCNELPVLFLLFYIFIFYSVVGVLFVFYQQNTIYAYLYSPLLNVFVIPCAIYIR